MNPLACVLSRFSCVQFFSTLWTVIHQAPLSLGFSRQGYWSGIPSPLPGDLPNPGMNPSPLHLQHWQASSSALAPPGKPVNPLTLPLIGLLLGSEWETSILVSRVFEQQKKTTKNSFQGNEDVVAVFNLANRSTFF